MNQSAKKPVRGTTSGVLVALSARCRGANLLARITKLNIWTIILAAPAVAWTAEFQAQGWIKVAESRDEAILSTNAYGARFSLDCKAREWLYNLKWPQNIENWVGCDGSNYYHLTHMPGGTSAGAGTVRTNLEESGLVEFEKTLLFAFALDRNQNQGSGRSTLVPFLPENAPGCSVYACDVTGSEGRSGIPVSATFSVSDAQRKAVLASLSAAGDTNGAFCISNTYPSGLPATKYRLLSQTNVAGQVLPQRFELVYSYALEGTTKERYFLGEVTNYAKPSLESFLPPLKAGSWITDLRLGRTYLYKATNRVWLTAEAAAAVGRILEPAPR